MNPETPYEPDVPMSRTAPKGVCPVEMYNYRFCGRKLYINSKGSNETALCTMHSGDPEKDREEFRAEFSRLLNETGTVLDCNGFVFPEEVSLTQDFERECIFKGATFKRGASFYLSRFRAGADFSGATFEDSADFRNAEFRGSNFTNALFAGRSGFEYAVFHSVPQFQGARFQAKSSFEGTKFMSWANFVSAVFLDEVDFNEAIFADVVNFRFTRFAARVDFRQTQFHEGNEANSKMLSPSVILTLSFFEQPEKVTFYKTYMGQALLHNCDVSRLLFSNVRWLSRVSTNKLMVFDEVIDLADNHAKDLKPSVSSSDERNYSLVAEIYQQLQKNYDDRGDYWAGGDFHYGDMEMKRLTSPRRNRLARWAHRNLGLAAWYKYASEYGESYTRPIWWLLLVLLIFTFLYPISGLEFEAGPSLTPMVGVQHATLTYSRPMPRADASRESLLHAEISLFGNSLITSLYIAAFQKDLKFEPSYPFGRILALLEVLITSALIGLYLLAVRRQFRR